MTSVERRYDCLDIIVLRHSILPRVVPTPERGAATYLILSIVPLFRTITRSPDSSSRPALLPKPMGRNDTGAISLGFERHHGFYELACARLRPAGQPSEHVSRDFGPSAGVAHSALSRPPARRERKIALLVFFLSLQDGAFDQRSDRIEVARGGLHSWCHSLYRLSVHHPKDGMGYKWLADVFGLENDQMDDPFAGVLRFIQCRRAGQSFIAHLDSRLFDPTAVSLSVWEHGSWQQSPKQRAEILYDLIRQIPRWAPLATKLRGSTKRPASDLDIQIRGPWEDMPTYFRYFTEAKKVQLVGLNHQVFRSTRINWIRGRGGNQESLLDIAVYSPNERNADRLRRITQEINATNSDEPFNPELEELTVFIGSPAAHKAWKRNTGWHPEDYRSAEIFWRNYLQKISRLHPKAKVRLYTIDDVSPLVLHLEFPDGAAFLKWTPAMFGAYHPGNPGWNLLWNLGAPPPPHFIEITAAMNELPKRAKILAF